MSEQSNPAFQSGIDRRAYSRSHSPEEPISLEEIQATAPDVLGDPARLNALRRLHVLDTDPTTEFNLITDVARRAFGVKYARIHFLDDVREWVQSSSGESACFGIPVEQSVCQYTIRQDRTLVIKDLSDHEQFRNHLSSLDGELIRFYAGAPLTTSDGHNVGVLCLKDPDPMPHFRQTDVVLLERLAELTARSMEKHTAEAGVRDELIRAVEVDAITGVLSRRGLLTRLQRLIERGSEQDTVAVIELRPTRLERIEQGYGTPVLNQLLRDISERLGAASHSNELLGRPDELSFMLVIPFTGTDPAIVDHGLEARAGEVMEALSAPFDIAGNEFHADLSAGLAYTPTHGRYGHELIGMAHEAAMRAVTARPGRLAWPDNHAVESQKRRISLEGRLRRAVTQNELTVAYQPILALNEQRPLAGAEALTRWPQPEDHQFIGPSVFITLAEELGLMDRIGLQVFEAAIHQLRRWDEIAGSGDMWISVNIAPVQLRDTSLPSQFADIARQAGIETSRVKLEITESALAEGFDVAGPVVDGLAQAGFPLALDDFGTGQSSLSRLINMPFSMLKVDRSFVRQIPHGPGAAVVSSLHNLAERLNMTTLAEGVENPEQERFLQEIGYRFVQGFHYGEAMTSVDLDGWMRHRE